MKKNGKKARGSLDQSSQPSVNATRSGSVSPMNDGNLPAAAGADLAGDTLTKALADLAGVSQTDPYDGLPTDANLSRIDQRARQAYGQVDKGQRFGLPPAGEGGLPYPANADRTNARAAATSTPTGQVAALDKAIVQLDKAIAKVRSEPGGILNGGRLERLEKALRACGAARATILAKSDRSSAGTDPTFRQVASNESAAPGYASAVAGIAKLQRGR